MLTHHTSSASVRTRDIWAERAASFKAKARRIPLADPIGAARSTTLVSGNRKIARRDIQNARFSSDFSRETVHHVRLSEARSCRLENHQCTRLICSGTGNELHVVVRTWLPASNPCLSGWRSRRCNLPFPGSNHICRRTDATFGVSSPDLAGHGGAPVDVGGFARLESSAAQVLLRDLGTK